MRWVLLYFLSAALRFCLSRLTTSVSHAFGVERLAGFVARGQSLLKEDWRVVRRVDVAASVGRAEKVSLDGRADRMSEERLEGSRERRLGLYEKFLGAVGGLDLCINEREKDIKKWSDRWRGVTVVLVMLEFREKIRSRVLPAL